MNVIFRLQDNFTRKRITNIGHNQILGIRFRTGEANQQKGKGKVFFHLNFKTNRLHFVCIGSHALRIIPDNHTKMDCKYTFNKNNPE